MIQWFQTIDTHPHLPEEAKGMVHDQLEPWLTLIGQDIEKGNLVLDEKKDVKRGTMFTFHTPDREVIQQVTGEEPWISITFGGNRIDLPNSELRYWRKKTKQGSFMLSDRVTNLGRVTFFDLCNVF